MHVSAFDLNLQRLQILRVDLILRRLPSKMTKTGEPDVKYGEKTEVVQPDDILIGSDHPCALNASGHPDQLDRQYGILSICGMALTVDNAWVAVGTSMNVAICESATAHERHWTT